MPHEQYSEKVAASLLRIDALDFLRKKECSIARSYHSAKRIAARTPVTDLAGSLPAGLWGNPILGGASRLDAFSGYPCRT